MIECFCFSDVSLKKEVHPRDVSPLKCVDPDFFRVQDQPSRGSHSGDAADNNDGSNIERYGRITYYIFHFFSISDMRHSGH